VTEPQEPRGAAPAHLTPDELSECAFSPETVAAGLREHAEGCPACSVELNDLRLLLSELAELPEPELPESVAVRMDAAIERAWQDIDAEQERRATVARANARRGRQSPWRKFALPLASLSLIAVAAVGIGVVVSHTSTNSSAGSPAGVSAENAPRSSQALTNPEALAWARSILPSDGTGTYGGTAISPNVEGVHCADASIPQRSGETVLTTSHREFDGQPATLVLYTDAKEPASSTVYAVVYAGSCPSSASIMLAQGIVSR
jgi:hypothetical protein